MNDITKWICEWLAAHYRKNAQYNFYWKMDDKWSWAQHVGVHTPNYNYMIISAGNGKYEFSIKSGYIRFHAEG